MQPQSCELPGTHWQTLQSFPLTLLRAWTATGLRKAPSAYQLGRSAGLSYKPCKRVIDALRAVEASLIP